jgi:hypothetical protein
MNAEFEKWYSREDVLFEIVKQLKGRETSFLSPDVFIRCVKAHALCFLAQNFRRYDFFKHQCNLYRTVASLYGMPMFSFNYMLKKEQQFWFVDNFSKYMTGYDLVIDIDGKDGVEPARLECAEIKEMLDYVAVPYSLKFSGSGFHLEVPSLYLDSMTNDPLEKLKLCLRFAMRFKKIMVLKYFDDGIYDLRRIFKVALSWDYKTGRIAMPLTDEQFAHFNLDMVNPAKIKSVRNLGSLLRTHNCSEQELKDHTKLLFEKFL